MEGRQGETGMQGVRDIVNTLSERDAAKCGHTVNMISLNTHTACVYLCLCMSTLTLIASIMALYILIAQTKDNKVIDRRNVEEEKRQEGRQAMESACPRCLTQL